MKTFKQALIEQEQKLAQEHEDAVDLTKVMYKNDQSPRLSGQGFTADPSDNELTFEEFLESYFGHKRLNATIDDFESQHAWQLELEHAGYVLADNTLDSLCYDAEGNLVYQ